MCIRYIITKFYPEMDKSSDTVKNCCSSQIVCHFESSGSCLLLLCNKNCTIWCRITWGSNGGKQNLIGEMMAELWAILHLGVAKNMEKKSNQRFKPHFRRQLSLQALIRTMVRKSNSNNCKIIGLVLLKLGFFEVCIIEPVFRLMQFGCTKCNRKNWLMRVKM